MQARLNGRIWHIRFERPEDGSRGDCDGPHVTGKAIRVSPTLAQSTELDTLIHECLHACAWDMSEEWVSTAASDIARLLYRLGWRRQRGIKNHYQERR